MEPDGLVGSTLVGRFRIDKVLGKGGMATVYAAFDQKRGSPVALKVLKKDLTRDAMVVRRFQREAKAASHLMHPNVVEVLDWGVEGEEAFISMELAQGTDLLKALARQRPMKQVRVVLVLAQVCAALSAAHSKGIVHRDLKPENILLVPDPLEPGGERAKVLDFGIAKILDVGKGGASGDDPPSYVTKTALTRVGTIVGTPAYMSPEQCRGGEIDGRSDVYACGILLYQLVTGELPFTGETPLHTAMRHIHAQPRAPSELRRDLAPALERVILKALSKWPGERHQSADALRQELLASLPGLPDRDQVVLPDSFGEPSPAAPRVATSAVAPSASSAEAASEVRVDPTQPTRHLVGGALGATPLKAVRLGGPMDVSPASSAAVSLQPNTTRPDSPLAEDDEPRTAAMDMFDDEPSSERGAQLDDGIPTSDPIETPIASLRSVEVDPSAPAARVVVEVKTDPMEQRPRGNAATMVHEPGTAPTLLPDTPPRIAHASQSQGQAPLSGLGAAPLRAAPAEPRPAGAAQPRVVARTERTPGAPKMPPRIMKSTQTGLTPTMSKAPLRPASSPVAVGGGLAPQALAAIPAPAPSPPAGFVAREPAPSVDDDEPATYVREPAGPTGKTLVMEDAAAAVAAVTSAPAPQATARPSPANPSPPQAMAAAQRPTAGAALHAVAAPAHAVPAAMQPGPQPQQASQPQHQAAPVAPQAQPAAHPMATSYSSQENDLRGLKATARIQEESSTAGQQSFATTGDSLQAVKATMRMSPHETPPQHAPRPASTAPPSQDAPSRPIPAPPPSGGAPELSAMQQTGYRQLAAGGWNEATVVKRRSPAHPSNQASQKEGMISLLQGLSGTTGLLIGIGLGLGIAAGLLIVFLLYVG
ncbi:MAG: protein kinase [Polyangiaceae bacterium]|nr:protein kinase [Polyangiaceae bacterium]